MELKEHRKYDLEERLINFALEISKIVDKMPNTRLGNYLAGQLIRCGNSPAFNYGEAQSAESTNDFIHKIKIILKELRETRIGLIITQRAKLLENIDLLKTTISEYNQLNAIFVKSVDTVRKNHIKTKKKDE